MDEDTSTLDLQIAEESDDQTEHIPPDEGFSHTVIIIEELQEVAVDTESDDLFDESIGRAENERDGSVDIDLDDVDDTASDICDNECDQSNLNGNDESGVNTHDDDDNFIIVDMKSADEAVKNAESTSSEGAKCTIGNINLAASGGEKQGDLDCILISDDEDLPVKSSNQSNKKSHEVKKRKFKRPTEVTEESIMNEFYFEDEDVCIVDEQKLDGPKKILVRRTPKGFRCPLYCTFSVKDKTLLIEHLIKHKKSVVMNLDLGDASYECPMCPFMTFYHSAFVKHICYHKKNNYGLICSKCPFTADTLFILKKHVASKHAAFIFCQNCPFKTRSKKNLRKHEERCMISPKKCHTFKCHFEPCPFRAPTEENLKTHEWIQHQVGSSNIHSHKCPLDGCYFETFRQELFEEHMGMHAGEQMRCKLCNYKSVDFSTFKHHILQHISVP